jgi:hypothetical protein
MGRRSDWLVLGGMLLTLALPRGVKWTALGLDAGDDPFRLWAGLPLLAAGVVGLECVHRCVALLRSDPGRLGIGPQEARLVGGFGRTCEGLLLVGLPVVTALEFVLLLDGHVHLRACGWLFLAYAVGAAVVWVGRRAPTRWGSCYLRWGWAPVVAFGVPLGLPALLAAGLVSPVIPPG